MAHRGKNAIVSGASRGIGKAIVQDIAKEGGHVLMIYVSDSSKQLCDDLIDEVKSYGAGGKACAVQADMSQMASVGIVKRAADEHFGEGAPIWAIINNSGTAVFKPAEEQTEEEYDRQMALNCKVPFFLVAAFLPQMGHGGRIIAISSRIARAVIPHCTTFMSSKAALEAQMRGLAFDLKPRGITCNSVAPGPVETDLLHKTGQAAHHPAESESRISKVRDALISSADIASTDHVAHAVMYLLSPRAQAVTGSTCPVNLGLWMD